MICSRTPVRPRRGCSATASCCSPSCGSGTYMHRPRTCIDHVHASTTLLKHDRFGGTEFPPRIYYKVYVRRESLGGVKYLSGKTMIQPASSVRACILRGGRSGNTQAAADALRLMGKRRFLEQMIGDTYDEIQCGTGTPVTLKEFMQVGVVIWVMDV